MNILLANCSVNNGNRGCVALSLSIMYLIDKLLNKSNIPHVFYLPDSGFRLTGNHTFHCGGVELKYKSCQNISFYNKRNALENMIRPRQYFSSRKIYKDADFILDIGQGDSFADIYGEKRFKWIYSEYKLAKKFNIPLCILPQTIGPFNDAGLRKKAMGAVRSAKCVMVRDKQSADYVKSLLPNLDVTEIIDVAFFMPYEKKEFNKEYIHVGLNISALLWNGGYTMDNQFGLKSNYQCLIRGIVEYFLSKKDVKLHLIPHVVGGERGLENDYAVAYDIYEEYCNENLILAPLFFDPIVAKNYIAGMDFFMGARMHSAIAAFSSEVAVYPMAYSRKFNGLFLETLDYPIMGDMKVKDERDILLDIKKAYFQRAELKNIIRNRMATVVAERYNLLMENLMTFFKI